MRPRARAPAPTLTAPPTRLMIVDDSLVARTILARAVEACGMFELIGLAANADQALVMLGGMSVDIILLDVNMPGTDGLTALPALIAASGGAKVLIVSSACADGAAASVRALTLGAADTLLKPDAGSLAGQFADTLVDRLLRISGGGEMARVAAGPEADRIPTAEPVECLAIGASTGGPHALTQLLKEIPADFPAPILITQHLPASFIPFFAEQLHEITGRRASVAQNGALPRAGEILVAPGDAHIRVVRRFGTVQVRLDRTSADSGCSPSVDPMMESVGEVYGPTALAVMLTGMGRDGLAGARSLVAAGGELFAQDGESSVVWGMPGAVAEAGLATAVLPPARIARRIAARVRNAAWK